MIPDVTLKIVILYKTVSIFGDKASYGMWCNGGRGVCVA